jgi:response regulator RpfG family c-di-GMP phosphodiesterase
LTVEKLLLVDDEQSVLDGLKLILGRQYAVVTATGGVQALQCLAEDGTIGVIVSDMRMPMMSGAEFLAHAHRVAPETVRLVLTGQADITSAITAINDGQIFRFLTKPVPPKSIQAAIEAAFAQRRLVLAEKVLLEQTLRGSIQSLSDVLALGNPALFGRATRIRTFVNAVMREMALPDQWQIDVAAMLLPLGQMSLPAEVADKVCHAEDLTAEERAMIARVPELTDNLLAHIPRLEVVRIILANVQEPYRQSNCIEAPGDAAIVLRGVQLLRLAIYFDALTHGGMSYGQAIAMIRQQGDRFDADMVAALGALYSDGAGQPEVLEIPIRNLTAGMVLAEDFKTRTGLLLVTRGCAMTAAGVERVRNLRAGTLKDKVWIVSGGEK